MKKVFMCLGALLTVFVACCAIYFVGNRITLKEEIEALNGTYALIDRRIDISSNFQCDSLFLRNLPQIGERIVLYADEDGVRIESAEASDSLQQVVGAAWNMNYNYHTWFGLTHSIYSLYTTFVDDRSLSMPVNFHRYFWGQTHVGLMVMFQDSNDTLTVYRLIFQKME